MQNGRNVSPRRHSGSQSSGQEPKYGQGNRRGNRYRSNQIGDLIGLSFALGPMQLFDMSGCFGSIAALQVDISLMSAFGGKAAIQGAQETIVDGLSFDHGNF